VKISTNYEKVSDTIAEEPSTIVTDVLLSIPLIVIIIILIFLIINTKRKQRKEDDDDKKDLPKPDEPKKPEVVEGELVSEPEAATPTRTALQPPAAGPGLPPGQQDQQSPAPEPAAQPVTQSPYSGTNSTIDTVATPVPHGQATQGQTPQQVPQNQRPPDNHQL
jgi:FtsZ-interacting cell division protein ZipA